MTTKILLIDDMPNSVALLEAMFEWRDYKVTSALSGKEGLKIAHEIKPDIILLDIMMPEMNGFEVCRHLKNDPELKDIPVIFISAIHDKAEKVQAFELGGVDYIVKPFDFKEVAARVSTHLFNFFIRRELHNLIDHDFSHHVEEIKKLSVSQETETLEAIHYHADELLNLVESARSIFRDNE